MFSTKDPDIDVNLKILLAKEKHSVDFPAMQQCALVMEDMLKACEKGRTHLTPRTKNRYYLTEDGPFKTKGELRQKQMKDKEAQYLKEIEKMKDQKHQQR